MEEKTGRFSERKMWREVTLWRLCTQFKTHGIAFQRLLQERDAMRDDTVRAQYVAPPITPTAVSTHSMQHKRY